MFAWKENATLNLFLVWANLLIESVRKKKQSKIKKRKQRYIEKVETIYKMESTIWRKRCTLTAKNKRREIRIKKYVLMKKWKMSG